MRVLIFLVGLQIVLSHKRQQDGTLYHSIALGIRPFSRSYDLISLDYPEAAPHTMTQVWRYVSFNDDTEPKALRLDCTHISIPKVSGDSCGKFSLKMKDGEKERVYCGEVDPFSLITENEDVTWKLETGPEGGAKVNCSVEAIYIDEDRQEVTTTTEPPPTKPAYLYEETEEIDSDEEGGVAGAKRTSCPCGWANKLSSRIVNGTVTREHEFPFMAGLVYLDSNWRFCGATIVTSYHAITATHCTEGKVHRELGLLIGDHDLTDEMTGPTEVIPIEVIVEHDGYKKGIYIHDIALIILKRRITFGQFVGPACLPTKQLQLDGQYVKVIGWGADVFKGWGSTVLKKVNLRVVPMKQCNYVYSAVSWENPTQICTYRTRRDSCQGDSGGPVVWLDPETNRYTVVGAVSFGRICGDAHPSVSTDIGAYLDWIHHFIKVSKPGNVCTKVD